MPRIKRWFPVSHDINRDPEMWDLEAKFGPKALRIWLELLSIADRNEGDIPGEINSISTAVAWAVRAKSTKVLRCINALTTLGWLSINEVSMGVTTAEERGIYGGNDRCLKVTKWSKYHRTEERKKVPSEPSEPNLPNHPPKVPQKKAAASPDGFAEFWSLYPKKKSKGQAEKAWRSLNLTAELFTAILAGVRRGKSSRDWLKDSGKFIPHPATWIRAKGWEDQEAISFTPKREGPKLVEKKPTPEDLERSREFIRNTISSLSHKMSSG